MKGRLSGIIDLVSAETVLHKLCSTKFYDMRSLSSEMGSGRRIDEDRENLVKKLSAWLDENMEHQLYTLEEVYQKYPSFDTTEGKSLSYTKRYLKSKLKEMYGDSIYFTNQERRADVLCFKDTTANIIREYHKNDGIGDEKTKIIKAAVKLLKILSDWRSLIPQYILLFIQ